MFSNDHANVWIWTLLKVHMHKPRHIKNLIWFCKSYGSAFFKILFYMNFCSFSCEGVAVILECTLVYTCARKLSHFSDKMFQMYFVVRYKLSQDFILEMVGKIFWYSAGVSPYCRGSPAALSHVMWLNPSIWIGASLPRVNSKKPV